MATAVLLRGCAVNDDASVLQHLAVRIHLSQADTLIFIGHAIHL
jgi:hypothetical protein